MEVSYHEYGHHTTLDISKHPVDVHVTRERGEINLKIRRECEGVYASVSVCFDCEEYERFLCELERVACGHRDCCAEREHDEEIVVLFDQDDCDEPAHKPTTRKPGTKTTKGGK